MRPMSRQCRATSWHRIDSRHNDRNLVKPTGRRNTECDRGLREAVTCLAVVAPSGGATFFAGVLPEGRSRELIARILGISETNDFAFLERIGGECAGAVTPLP